MESRRSFLKKASMLAGATAISQLVPASIQRALAIDAAPGSTFLDAEHIVFLMQENRSFDHCYGALRGVRGFNDPRTVLQPDKLPVWIQQSKDGKAYAPFRLDIKNTKATWMGSLPHSWKDMVAARNNGHMDTWLDAKKPGNKEFEHMPLTMGYYDRNDIPFYYALADAFTVCDQHFCSSLTGTSANRSYFWSGTIREQPHDGTSKAHVYNGQINYQDIGWKTYPERLQEAGISWNVYQNELSLPVGFKGEEEDWLANFTDNNLEFSKQYHVGFHPAHVAFVNQQLTLLRERRQKYASEGKDLKSLDDEIQTLQTRADAYSPEKFAALTDFEREIHKRAFVTNTDDPQYHSLTTIDFEGQQIQVPAGDIFHQFRKDVQGGKLPTVSWLVAPCNFSDHPGAPWYGAWYVSEALDILTQDPEVWKKTIFILTYDENDGYFDHVAPFVPPNPSFPDQGAVNFDVSEEFVESKDAIGLGFRVPLVIASPWSKGGYVNSEIFDHTSSLQFLEYFFLKKTGKRVSEDNISQWRRMVCGDLTSVFRLFDGSRIPQNLQLDRNHYVEGIFAAKTKGFPGGYKAIGPESLNSIRKSGVATAVMPAQEKGTKPACALPYNLMLDIAPATEGPGLLFDFGCELLAEMHKTIAVPFQLYSYSGDAGAGTADVRCIDFTVSAGKPMQYISRLDAAEYHFRAHGPNGFFREFSGRTARSVPAVSVRPGTDGLSVDLLITGHEDIHTLTITDLSYGSGRQNVQSDKGKISVNIPLKKSNGWYDFSINTNDASGFTLRFAGHIENGKESTSDPMMGQAS